MRGLSRQGSTGIPDKTVDHTMKSRMSCRGYVATLEFDPEDNILVGRERRGKERKGNGRLKPAPPCRNVVFLKGYVGVTC